MAIKTVINRFLNYYDEGLIEFPQNRMLYADQFTDEGPFTDEDREGFKPRNIKDVFEYYQPHKEGIALKTEDGEVVYENFYFKSIKDFEDNQLIAQSEILRKQESKAIEQLRNNLRLIHEQIRGIEIAYRTLYAFFANTGIGEVDCLTLMNVNKDELKSHDSKDIVAICKEIDKYYDRLNLKDNYSLLVVPSYLGDSNTIRMWADMAYRNKVILLTDFKDSFSFEILKEELYNANLQGKDVHLSNVVMTCNYLLGRKKSKLANEDDDVYIPGSAALAGRMANTDEIVITHGVAGMKYGRLSNVKGVRLNLRKAEIATLIDLGVIPMIETDGRTMAFSDRTLYNGCTACLQKYPIVRVLDWMTKVIQCFINRSSYVNWDERHRSEILENINNFLCDYMGPDKLFQHYKLIRFELDKITKDIIFQVELDFSSHERYLLELVCYE